ncbi:tripartite tricarboxylate transporter permease [Paracoccus seriniphilus]|uniref:Putative tricarboxylic transport membrane protein n=1 Tax=Paracoccus seriniphilus TaxID=184748 RepID=A0A239PTL4_9RHOB|nr:tripartite tricarboxylate transporter permease [Paracoccus seriniphilus]WCR16480.1 tripartite tricarboxylate transporter permease [Paracoccus seriniphilus]SNT73639.1 putative tricarboxylic transport membrane protein [Paracoccus seriniphilus]
MDFTSLAAAFGMQADLTTLAIMFLATFLGMIVGALPGLGTVTALAIVLPFTFVLGPTQAIGMLTAIYVSSVYGGSIPAILINVPGTPQSAATVLDGYPMAQSGKAAEALGWVTVSSAIGGVFSMVVLMFLAPQLAQVAVKFGSIETFALIVFSLTTIAWVSAGNPLKGLLAGLIGIVLSTVGIDALSGAERFTFGNFELSAGLHVVPILIGLFALSEVFAAAAQPVAGVTGKVISAGFKVAPWREWKAVRKTMLRSSLIGTFLGILPGVGATAASLIGYAQARSSARTPETFGKGNPEGIVASEAANNAVTGGALVPTLALGIPGDAATAVMLGALVVHGITPGVNLFQGSPDLVNFVFVALLVANVMMLIVGALAAQMFSRVLKLPHALIMGGVLALALAGSYVTRFSMIDLWVTLLAGVLGLLLRFAHVPLAPIVIGFILGQPFEESLRKGLIITDMQPLRFLASPIVDLFFAITLAVIVWPLIAKARAARN